MSTRDAIIAACKLMGSQATLARHLGVTRQAIGKWIKAGRTPGRRVLAIEQATQGLLTRYELRPDFYPRYEPLPRELAHPCAEDTPYFPPGGAASVKDGSVTRAIAFGEARMSHARFRLLYDALSVLGGHCLSRDDLAELQELTLEELDRLSQRSARFMTITFDRTRFTSTKAQVRRQMELERRLLGAGAPFVMMRHFLGFTWEDFTARRKALGLQGDGIGRPAAPTEEVIGAVWQAWQDQARQVPSTALGPEHYLAIHQVTGVPLRIIWTLLQQWISATGADKITPMVNSVEPVVRPRKRRQPATSSNPR